MLNQNAKRQRDGHGGVTRVVLRVRIIACAIVVVGLLSRAEAAVFNIPAGNVALINAIKARMRTTRTTRLPWRQAPIA